MSADTDTETENSNENISESESSNASAIANAFKSGSASRRPAATAETDRVADDYRKKASTRREVAPLLARRRENLDRDGHIASDRYDFRRDEDDHKIRRVEITDGETGDESTDHDLTATEGAAPSTTASIPLIVAEAELANEGVELGNPHIPRNDRTLAEALDRLEDADLTPAWEVIDR
jgi:hypothetical protein